MSELRKNIKSLRTSTLIIELSENQYFYETPKAYEIWTNTPILSRIKRISKQSVFFVEEY